MFSISGAREFEAALDKMVTEVEVATVEALTASAKQVEAAAKERISGPPRWLRGEHFPREGGPGVVTGRLRDAIRTFAPVRTGVGVYSVTVKPDGLVYAARTERRYPYMTPAKAAAPGFVHPTFRDRWAAALRR